MYIIEKKTASIVPDLIDHAYNQAREKIESEMFAHFDQKIFAIVNKQAFECVYANFQDAFKIALYDKRMKFEVVDYKQSQNKENIVLILKEVEF